MAKELIFYYDVVCPFANIASRVIEDIAVRSGATLKWRPILLGGIYKSVRPDGSSNSAAEHMCEAKRSIIGSDLKCLMQRYDVPFKSPSVFPISTVSAMRLLAAAPCEPPNNIRTKLTHALYAAYWCNDEDIADLEVLSAIAKSVGWKKDIEKAVEEGKEKLHQNTDEAASRGAFGVPSFWVRDELYFGVDRFHFVERSLGNETASLPRLVSPSDTPTKAQLTIYHDFSSPWSYIGSKQINSLVQSVLPVDVEVEWVPILLGALFKEIGTPVVPLLSLSPAKAAHMNKDLQRWCQYLNINFRYNTSFPLRTVLPLRASIAEPSSKLLHALYSAAWEKDKNIGDEQVVIDILKENGLQPDNVLSAAQTQTVKDKLKANTNRALHAGVCGVPSYQVNGGPVIWGQDRLNVVADMICDWMHHSQINHKL